MCGLALNTQCARTVWHVDLAATYVHPLPTPASAISDHPLQAVQRARPLPSPSGACSFPPYGNTPAPARPTQLHSTLPRPLYRHTLNHPFSHQALSNAMPYPTPSPPPAWRSCSCRCCAPSTPPAP